MLKFILKNDIFKGNKEVKIMLKIIEGEKIEGRKYDFRETCFGIVVKNNKMLLVNKKGQYSFVGGGVENGETHEECLKREFMEESGYTITKINELVTVDCFWLAAGQWPLESLANFYVVEVADEHVSPTEEGHTPEFVDIDKVEELLPLPYHKRALKYYFETR